MHKSSRAIALALGNRRVSLALRVLVAFAPHACPLSARTLLTSHVFPLIRASGPGAKGKAGLGGGEEHFAVPIHHPGNGLTTCRSAPNISRVQREGWSRFSRRYILPVNALTYW